LDKEISEETLHEDTDLIQTFGFNSLDMIQFVLKSEDEFGIEIDIENFRY
jgi:acyl carrier protein